MFSPFEELEYLAEYLPDEGEVVLITRQSGDLVCKPLMDNDLRDGISDTQLYGFLIQANERLELAQRTPIWFCSVLYVWHCRTRLGAMVSRSRLSIFSGARMSLLDSDPSTALFQQSHFAAFGN